MNSDGQALVGWQEPEQETDQERIARRYRTGRCVACGTADRLYRTTALCRACHTAGTRFCRSCGAVVAVDRYHRGTYRCNACHAAANRAQRDARRGGMSGREAQARNDAARKAAGRALADAMHAMRGRGWTWAEIARASTAQGRPMTARAAATRYGHYYKDGRPRRSPYRNPARRRRQKGGQP